MARKIVKYLLLTIIIGLLAYKSVFIVKLSELQTIEPKAFDAPAFVQKLWNGRLPARLDSALTLDALQAALKANQVQTFDNYLNSMSIGNIRYGLVKVTGKVLSINDDEVVVLTGSKDNQHTVKIATEYIYGNAIRDASRLVDIKDFVNTTDLNKISEELNKEVRTKVLPAFKGTVQKADSVICTGALELNQARSERSRNYSLDDVEIIPVQCKIIQQ
jgi:predicted lipoprotein